MIRTYKVKERRNGWGGYGWKPIHEIYAKSWHEAKQEFTDWLIGWLDNKSSDTAIELLAELRSGKPVDSFTYDVYDYTIGKV